jgi:hypothetical protein
VGISTGTCSVPQSILRKKNPEPPRTAAAHSGPAFGSMGERLGLVKRVRFSCGATIIPPQVFNPSPPNVKPHPDPDFTSGSGRSRRKPERLGIDSVEPLSSPLGGGAVGRLAKATFITFFVYLCSTNVELVTKPNLDNNKQIYLNHQLLLTCVVLSLEYYVSYRTTYITMKKQKNTILKQMEF